MKKREFPGVEWENLPDYVKERVTLHPWTHTREDRVLQAIYPGYFAVQEPVSKCWEIWVTNPPKVRSSIAPVRQVKYPNPKTGEMEPSPIDERVVVILKQFDPDRGMGEREFMEYMAKAIEIEAKRRTTEEEDGFEKIGQEFAEKVLRVAGDQNFQGRILRPMKPVSLFAPGGHR